MTPPLRIVSLVPSQTELLFWLGLDAEVVGITKFCVHPADKVRDKVKVGGTKTVNLARVRALHPTLVLANREENERGQIEALAHYVPVHVTDVTTLADALTMIRAVGERVGKPARAHQLANALAADFAQLAPTIGSQPAAAGRGVTVAYLIWRKPWMVAAATTFINAVLTAAGFRNAFGGQSRYPAVTEAELRAADPDLIFLSSEPYPFRDRHVAELRAICPRARVWLVDGELFSWYGPRLLQSAAYLADLRQRVDREDV